jgi:hypothetical protein
MIAHSDLSKVTVATSLGREVDLPRGPADGSKR